MKKKILISVATAGLLFSQTLPTKVTTALPPGVTVTGVVVLLSTGAVAAIPLGYHLAVVNSALQVLEPLQYVGQPAAFDPATSSWKYPKPGRNVQVWRNGVLMKFGVDYDLDTAGGRILPRKFTFSDGSGWTWLPTDSVQVNYVY